MKLTLAAMLFAAFATAAVAQDCDAWAVTGDPAAATLSAAYGDDNIHFRFSASESVGCPAADGCERSAYVVNADPVMVAPGDGGDFVCAVFVGYAPGYAVTAGWLPAEQVFAIDDDYLSPPDLLGDWHYGEFHALRIDYGAAAGFMVLSGEALYGAEDADRVARGAVNIGSFDGVEITPAEDGAEVAFTLDWDGVVGDYDADSEMCAVRMWRRGPYLAVTDNVRCGGNNVTFGGIYRSAE